MNLPNRLTVARVVMIPIFVALFELRQIPGNYLIAFVVFVLASITDSLDGKIARSRGLDTDFGRLMDPLADKILVSAALVCLLHEGTLTRICLIIVLAREFLVTSIRLLAAQKGQVLAADMWGKIKTTTQMLYVCFALFVQAMVFNFGRSGIGTAVISFLTIVLFWAMFAMTVASGLRYFIQNRKLFSDL